MNKIIEEKLNIYINKIIFNQELSLVEQTAQVHQFFKKFDKIILGEHQMPFKSPSPEEIKRHILEAYKIEEDMEYPKLFTKYTEQIAIIIINDNIDKILIDYL